MALIFNDIRDMEKDNVGFDWQLQSTMRASELIDALTSMVKRFGDFPVLLCPPQDDERVNPDYGTAVIQYVEYTPMDVTQEGFYISAEPPFSTQHDAHKRGENLFLNKRLFPEPEEVDQIVELTGGENV